MKFIHFNEKKTRISNVSYFEGPTTQNMYEASTFMCPFRLSNAHISVWLSNFAPWVYKKYSLLRAGAVNGDYVVEVG